MFSTLRDISAKDRSTAFLIFGFLLACYLFTYTGVIDSTDGLSMYATAENVVRRGAIDSNQILWTTNQQGNIGLGGDLYSRKGVGMVALAVPLIWIGQWWAAVGSVHMALLLNPLLTAWTGALLFRTGRRLGWSRSTAIAGALLFGIATMAWPYTQGFFSDPVCGWGLFAAAYGLFSYSQSRRKHYLLLAGIAWGIAYLTRTINLMTLPVYLLGVYWVIEAAENEGQPLPVRRLLEQHWRPLVSFLIPIAVAGVISLWWNAIRFGNPFDSGYVETETFSADWLFGFFGLTFGPARGIVWYNPVYILLVPGMLWFWRQQRKIGWLIVLLTGLYLLVYAKWYMWHGGFSWGPRFLVPILPFLGLVMGASWHQLVERRTWGIFGPLLFWLLALVSVGIQLLGLAVPYDLVQNQLAATVTPLFAPESFTVPAYSPLLMQWQFLTAEHIHFAWWHPGAGSINVNWIGLAMPVAALLVGIILLVQHMKDQTVEANDDSVRNSIYAIAVILIGLALLTYLQVIQRDSEIAAVAERIRSAERSGDAILMLDQTQTQTFANSYRGNLLVYGFFQRDRLDADEEAWLNRIRGRHQRLWVAPNYMAANESDWERRLRTEDFLLADELVTGPNDRRIALYALAPAQQMTEAGIGTVFGDPGVNPVTEASGWFRLNGYAVTAQVSPGQPIALTLNWQSIRPVDYDYHVFVHLLDEQGNKLAQRDGQPVQWMRPTSTWQTGDEISDHYGILLPETLALGKYTIAVGLYDPVTGQRLPVSAGPTSYAIALGPIEVVQERTR